MTTVQIPDYERLQHDVLKRFVYVLENVPGPPWTPDVKLKVSRLVDQPWTWVIDGGMLLPEVERTIPLRTYVTFDRRSRQLEAELTDAIEALIEQVEAGVRDALREAAG